MHRLPGYRPMLDLEPACENDVVLAFLRAEIDAPRYRDHHLQYLQRTARSRLSLIDMADLSNEFDNHARAISLASTRGYGLNDLLFRGYPNDVVWHRFEVQLSELSQFLYANYHTLSEVAGATRLVSEAAKRVMTGMPALSAEARAFADGISIVAERVKAGQNFPELVAVRDPRSANIVLMEGHTRATAFVISRTPSVVRVLIGSSSHIHEWWLI